MSFNYDTRLDNLGGYGVTKLLKKCGGLEKFIKRLVKNTEIKTAAISIAATAGFFIVAQTIYCSVKAIRTDKNVSAVN